MHKRSETVGRGFFINGERQGRGLRLTVGGVLSVGELTDSRILLVTHGARVELIGLGLTLSVFEGRAVEVTGKITEMRLLYGKN